ncbi:MAG: family 20 glycosylhydrolase [Bacteroidaceae bacterium]|nr:family 20 glycosylhydrolase [Bacteroidaceae bacterium]MBR4929331.1 family 20 glycosylhydrolase [Bacteroidaceae bacterium]
MKWRHKAYNNKKRPPAVLWNADGAVILTRHQGGANASLFSGFVHPPEEEQIEGAKRQHGYGNSLSEAVAGRALLCVGKETTIQFLQDVLDETCGLFPSAYMNIGDDEAVYTRWETCPDCQAVMKREGLSKASELQSYLTNVVGKMMKKKGRTLIGWDEIIQRGKLNDPVVALIWRNLNDSIKAIPTRGDAPVRLGTLKLWKRKELMAEVAADKTIKTGEQPATYRFTLNASEAGTPFPSNSKAVPPTATIPPE